MPPTKTTPTDWTTAAWPATVTGLHLHPTGNTTVHIHTNDGLEIPLQFPAGHPLPTLGETIHLTLRREPIGGAES